MCGEGWWGGGVNISVFLVCASTLLTGLGLCLCGRLGLGVLSVEKKEKRTCWFGVTESESE